MIADTVRARLKQEGPLSQRERVELTSVLRSAWGYPSEPALQERAASKLEMDRGSPPAAPAVGEVLLVAVDPNRTSRSRVFVLFNGADPTAPKSTRNRFDAAAQNSWNTAAQLGKDCAPFHVFVQNRSGFDPAARPLFLVGPQVTSLDGVSFGLSFVLSVVSQWTGLCLSPHIAASAAIDSDGALKPVQYLAEKIEAITDTALGVTHLLVARSQLQDPESRIALDRAKGCGLSVVGISTAQEATEYAFGDRVPELLPSGSAAVFSRQRSFRELQATVLSGHSQHWNKVVLGLSQLKNTTPWTDSQRLTLDNLIQIARRHSGESDGLELQWDSALVDARGNEHIAQILQAAADSGSGFCESYIERARLLINVAPAEPGSIKALGSVGRAYAALRQYDKALRCSRLAVERWERRDEPEASSYPLCMWLRCAGLLRCQKSLDDAILRAKPLLGDPHSGLFVHEALCSAYVLAGRFHDALRMEPRGTSPVVERWCARAFVATERRADAAQLRATLTQRATTQPSDHTAITAALFAAIDGALENDGGVDELVERVTRARLQGTRWLLHGADPRDQARRLANEYPYV